MRRFATGCAFNIHELMLNLKKNKLKMTCKLCKRINNDEHKDKLINKICMESMKLVLEDIIENSTIFELPTGSQRKTWIKMEKIDGELFKNFRRKRKFADVDFLTSNFSGYVLMFKMFYKDGRPIREKYVYVDGKRKKRITYYTNIGRQYY